MWRTKGLIEYYYNDKHYEAHREIRELSENDILNMDADKTATSYYERFNLPLLVKDTKRSIETKKISTIDVENDNGHLTLRRGESIRVSYPLKPAERIEESLQWSTRVENVSIPYNARYAQGYIQFDVSEEKVQRAISQLEDNMQRRNSEIELFNRGIKGQLVDYINDLKKALEQDRLERKKEAASRTKNRTRDHDDGDWDDDDDRGRTPNDDRSDTLNPNNPAYDDASDNRADQLNPNNPEYRGH